MEKQNVKRSNNKARTQQMLEMVKSGYDAKTIVETLGYTNVSAVYNTAKKHGLKVVPQCQSRQKQIIKLRKEGLSCRKIAEAVGITEAGVYSVVKKAGLSVVDLKVETETRRCELCGKEFTAPAYSNQKFCSADCERKANREKAKNNTDADDSHVQPMLDKLHPEWEYIGGYRGSEGRIDIKCRICGTVKNVSYITTRHPGVIMCRCVEEEKRKEKKEKENRKKKEKENQRKEQSRIAKIVKRFNRPAPKGEQLQMKTCPDCGAFYFGRGATCAECSVKRSKRIANRKKELKRKSSYTRESKMISARTLYERDGGICWICGGMCDINADPNSNYYPSVDHIVPQSLGGKDTLDNVRLAHRICNTVRRTNQNIEEVRSYLIPSG